MCSGVTKSGSPMPSEMTWSMVASTSKNLRMPDGRTRSMMDDVSRRRGFSAKARLLFMEVRVLLVAVRHAQDGLLVERLADDLQPNRQAVGQAARDRQAGQARHVDGDREHVVQVHGQRIVDFLAYLERRRWGSWCEEHVEALEGAVELLLDERPHFLRLEVVRIVVPGAQHVGAEHDAALDFGPEARLAGGVVLAPDVRRLL